MVLTVSSYISVMVVSVIRDRCGGNNIIRIVVVVVVVVSLGVMVIVI